MNASELPIAADRLRASRPTVLERFVERVRQAVPAARREPRPIVIDTLPAFLDHLIEALSPEHPRQLATAGTTIAQEHGGERVRLTGYRPDDIVREYQILREVLFDTLEEAGPLGFSDRQAILRSIDAAVLEACTAYHLVHEHLRERISVALTHDLRNPLTAALASAQLILRKPASPEVPRWAARIVDNIERAHRMIRDLLDASRLRFGGRIQLEIAPCNLVELVDNVVEHLRTEHGDRFVIDAGGPVQGQWSADALRRAIENLASNAVKYGAAGRPITLRIREEEGRAVLDVHNEGSYIPADEQETIFRAFHRAHDAEQSQQPGWGIGLALVRGVAEAHGGSIGIESLPETGTTFTLDIPLDARPFQSTPRTV
jgi:signal transduction histidine kinase